MAVPPPPVKPPIPKDPEQVKVEAGKSRAAALDALPDKVHTWPYLVRAEFIAGCVLILTLLIWSITVDAPLEEPANPNKTPNPSKAPWYFLGLQEMLVYFDPWFAGVVAPSMIIVGLMIIPYVDINPKGNGYYTFKERWFAISFFLFGFLFLWCGWIVLGVFFRGPGWNLYWPWEYWDPHKVVALTNVDLPYLLGARSYLAQSILGGILVVGFYAIPIPAFWLWKKNTPFMKELGLVRYALVAFFVWTTVGIFVKMVLRLTLNVKYIWVTPWISF